MAERTAIEWTNATWNPWRGCDRVSPGCAHCYMFREQRRYGLDPATLQRTNKATFRAPLSLKRYKPGTLVFTCSWSDWFHPAADGFRQEAWEIIRARPDLIFQVLTKRPERIPGHLPADWGEGGYPNVWLGVSIENRQFVHRAELLRRVPAAVRFISAEPLLGPLICPDCAGGGSVEPYDQTDGGAACPRGCADHGVPSRDVFGPSLDLRDIDWLIAGGESGPKCRRMDSEWVRGLRDACAAAGTAFFFKQWGGQRPGGPALLDSVEHRAMPAGAR